MIRQVGIYNTALQLLRVNSQRTNIFAIVRSYQYTLGLLGLRLRISYLGLTELVGISLHSVTNSTDEPQLDEHI